MIASFRAAVIAHLDATLTTPVHTSIPDDVAEVPCVVVGLASVDQGNAAAVLDLEATVWAIGRRQSAGGRDVELDELADAILESFGGTRAVTLATGETIHATGAAGRTVEIASKQHPAYTITVETSTVTC